VRTCPERHEAILRAALRGREDAEQALRTSQARFHAVFRDGATAIAIGDINGSGRRAWRRDRT
jgi:hypothetical protein